MNTDFSCTAKPNSMFNAINIESGFVVKPKYRFNIANSDFSCADARAPARNPLGPPP